MLYLVIFLLHLPVLLLIRLIAPAPAPPTSHDLLIQTAKLGDCLNTSPLIQVLGPIDVVCSHSCAHLFSRYDNVRTVYVVNEYKKRRLTGKLKLAYRLFGNRYRSIYTLQPNSLNLFLSLMALSASRKSLFVTYKNNLMMRLFCIFSTCTRHSKESLTIDSYLTMANKSGDSKQKHYPSPIPPSDEIASVIESNVTKIGISLSAGNKLKELPTPLTANLIGLIKEKCDLLNTQLLFFGIAGEEGRLTELQQSGCLENIQYHNLIGKLNLDETAWTVSKLNLYISTDTALSYLADCYDIPLINFMGPCSWSEQRPLGEKALIIKTPELAPFSFTFQAPYHSEIPQHALYTMGDRETEQITKFLETLCSHD